MNTTRIGNSLEEKIHDLLHTEIEADRFWAKKANCKLFRKKGYYSNDRVGNIIFDVAIEIYLPGALEYSMLVLVECKNYTHPVRVDEVEEFFTKVQQVSGANIKAVLASTASFQTGTLKFAKSKGMGLLRYFDKSNFKWELKRSPSASARSTHVNDAYIVNEGLSLQGFISTVFDLFLQSPTRETNSLWDFLEDVVLDTALTPAEVRKIANPRSRIASQVPFLEKEVLESLSAETLSEIDCGAGQVPLNTICAREKKRCNLMVLTEVTPPETDPSNPVLGRILFQPLEIHIYKQVVPNQGRERFTLAHELAHHLLHHSRYMSREYCDEQDFVLNRTGKGSGTAISRMEFQANYFAASLLMPRTNFIKELLRLVQTRDIPNRGFGALYVDNQRCNLESYKIVTGKLMRKYKVSRSAATIRLETLGLLRDARTSTSPQPI